MDKKIYAYSFLAGLASGSPLFFGTGASYQIGNYLIGLEKRVLGESYASMGATLVLLLALIFFLLNMVLREFVIFRNYSPSRILKVNIFFGLGMAVSVLMFITLVTAG